RADGRARRAGRPHRLPAGAAGDGGARAHGVRRVVRVLPPLGGEHRRRPARHLRRRGAPPAAPRGARLRRDLPAADPPDRAHLPQGAQQQPHPRAHRRGEPVGHRERGRRARRRGPEPRHRRGLHAVRRPRARARAGDRARLRAAVLARPPVDPRAPGLVPHPPRRHDRVRGEPAEEVPGHLPDQLLVRRPRGALGGLPRRAPVLGRARRHDVPRRQPAHQAVRLLGVGDRGGAARAPGGGVPRRGVHAAEEAAAAREAGLLAVVHVLHLEEHGRRAAGVDGGVLHPGRARVLPRQPLREHAGHPARVPRARRAARVPHAAPARRHPLAALRHLQRLRAGRERARAAGERGVPRLGEVPARAARLRGARQPQRGRAAAQRDSPGEPRAAAGRQPLVPP
ncbi:MAG: GH13_3 / GH13, partial [uncultured Thermomicrobiales bacterium]